MACGIPPQGTESDRLSVGTSAGEQRFMSDAKYEKGRLLTDIGGILQNMTADWDTSFDGGVTAATRLIGDLSFESIDVVQFIVALEEHFNRRDFPFEKLLMQDGRYVEELTVGEVVEFLHQQQP